MINHYFFLRQVAVDLQKAMVGSLLTAVVSPHKDELQLFFQQEEEPSMLRLNWETDQFLVKHQNTDVRLPRAYEKQLFEGWNRKVIAVEQALFDRYWFIQLEGQVTIVIKCFASAGNAMLVENGKVTAVFRRSRQRDYDFQPHDIPIELPDLPLVNDPRFGPWSQKIEGIAPSFDWKTWFQTPVFYWSKAQGIRPERLTDAESGSALVLANKHASWYLGQFLFRHRMHRFTQTFEAETNKLRSKMAQAQTQLDDLLEQVDYQTQASLLLSHMHAVPAAARWVKLPRWDDPSREVTIKLDPEKTIIENANRLFAKAKNQHIETEKRKLYLAQLAEQLEQMNRQKQALAAISSWKELLKFEQKSPSKSATMNPWRVYVLNQTEVWIGKNASGNDALLRRAHKDDLWLHARGLPGSHVLVRNAGKKIPQPMLETVAGWAAFFSKGKSEQFCPVAYTERKYVRKPKGAAPGAVLVERENVIIVHPQAPVSSE